jgi:chorismate lyase
VEPVDGAAPAELKAAATLRWWPHDQLDALQPPPALRPWLTHTGSLTQRLREHWPDLRVVVGQEGLGPIEPDEAPALARTPADTPAHLLAYTPGTMGWIRTVELWGGEQVRVRARTVIPDWSPDNPWAAVSRLGDRPLGEWLFLQPDLVRTAFEWRTPSPGNPAWARRCCFEREGAPLLLTEWMVNVAA